MFGFFCKKKRLCILENESTKFKMVDYSIKSKAYLKFVSFLLLYLELNNCFPMWEKTKLIKTYFCNINYIIASRNTVTITKHFIYKVELFSLIIRIEYKREEFNRIIITIIFIKVVMKYKL